MPIRSRADEETRVEPLNNYDPKTGRILIALQGSDPVLFGVHGISVEVVHRAGG